MLGACGVGGYDKEEQSLNSMIKSTLKLIFRTGIFWIFIVIMPVISIVMFKTNMEFSTFTGESYKVEELENADEKAGYFGGNGGCVIKIYDASGSEKSGFLINKLSQSGLFTVCRADISGENITDDFINTHIENDGKNDIMGAAVYIPASFDDMVMNGKYEEAVTLYILSDDERVDVLADELKLQLVKIASVADIDSLDDLIPERETVNVASAGEVVLTKEQNNQKQTMGYAFSFLTLGFVFAGFFVANTAIREQKNGVLVRINLAGIDTFKYFTSKFISVLAVSILMMIVVFACSFAIDTSEIGMDRLQYILLIFPMGLIFSSLSMFMGIVMGEVMSACVATFVIWVISCMFSGMYFPITHTTDFIKYMSYVMPQKWFMDVVDMLYIGDEKAYVMLLCITAAYLLLIISLGSFGLKVKRTESWGNS